MSKNKHKNKPEDATRSMSAMLKPCVSKNKHKHKHVDATDIKAIRESAQHVIACMQSILSCLDKLESDSKHTQPKQAKAYAWQELRPSTSDSWYSDDDVEFGEPYEFGAY